MFGREDASDGRRVRFLSTDLGVHLSGFDHSVVHFQQQDGLIENNGEVVQFERHRMEVYQRATLVGVQIELIVDLRR